MSKWLIILFCCVTLSSCFTSKEVRKKKRAAKLIEKAVRLVPSISSKDTIKVVDTLTIASVRSDTVISVHTDSFLIENDRLVIRYRKINDSIYITGECKGDTIIQTKEVIRDKIVYPEVSWWERFQWWWLLIAFGVYVILRKIKILS